MATVTVWFLMSVTITVHNAGNLDTIAKFATREACERLSYEIRSSLTGEGFNKTNRFKCFEATILKEGNDE